jgi:hypothetical protein
MASKQAGPAAEEALMALRESATVAHVMVLCTSTASVGSSLRNYQLSNLLSIPHRRPLLMCELAYPIWVHSAHKLFKGHTLGLQQAKWQFGWFWNNITLLV